MAGEQPAYRRVADRLRELILSGELAEGAQLPSLREIAARYGVATSIATRALDVLRTDGLVVSRPGAGTYVRRFERIVRSSPGRLAQARWRQGASVQDHDTGPRTRTVDVVIGDVPAPDFVAGALGIAPGAPVLSRARRFVVEERVVQLATSYLPTELTRGTRIEHTDAGAGGIYARLAEQGLAPSHFTERIVGRSPLPEEAAALELAVDGSRVLEITRYAHAGDRCVEVNRMVLDSDAYELTYSFPA
ncbi:GntR family transcriptional regulator [Catellatospora sp. IY07-71]|uniref:GntR family transcriptional regulator n=1 Tax=Catellatospora sp. IY07-71 TaxID=2728827 RepID=UPI001BB39F43|nr:GntR family transcriptional regulator [Catellatospora sp. IY07-71]BCJ77852.1 GntR family transcriptional regulator [Catellatospora sp. IY07-71]